MTLTRLNPSKAGSPDRISNWLLKDYSEFLAFPITKIINASFKKQRFLPIWKITGVSPLPKIKAVEDIMLTSAFLSNLASLVAVLSPCDLPSVRRTITSRTYYRSPRWLLKICKNRESYNSYGADKIIQLIQLRLFFQSRNPWPLRAFYTMSLHTICIYLFIYIVIDIVFILFV
jgi:hypothetical protein